MLGFLVFQDTAMSQHDRHYRQLFRDPALIRALIEHILPPAWSRLVDPLTLEAIPTDHVGSRMHARNGDFLWRVRRVDGQDTLYLLILMEHQSRPDRLMPVRFLGYTGLAFETLARLKLIRPGQPLPVVLPIVLYSGLKRWNAPLGVGDLQDAVPQELQAYQPRMRYVLLDEGALIEQDRVGADNLAGVLFHLEHNQGLEHAARLLQTVYRLTQGPEFEELRRAFGSWARHVLLPRAWPKHAPLPATDDLKEIITMTTVHHSRDWTLKYRQEGWQEGKQEGREEGRMLLLRRQLIHRFGPLSLEAEQRLKQAGATQLEAWSLNIFTAQTLDDVWNGGPEQR